MHTAIVLYLLKKESQLNEVCLGHKVRCTEFIRRRIWCIKYQLIFVLKIKEKF